MMPNEIDNLCGRDSQREREREREREHGQAKVSADSFAAWTKYRVEHFTKGFACQDRLVGKQVDIHPVRLRYRCTEKDRKGQDVNERERERERERENYFSD